MTFTQNVCCTITIGLLLAIYSYLLFVKRKDVENPEQEIYDLYYVLDMIKLSFNQILNMSENELAFHKDTREKRERLRLRLKRALRTCSFGNIGEKEYVKDYIKDLLQNQCHINHNNVDEVIPFHDPAKMTIHDKFDYILYCYKKDFGALGLEHMIEDYNLANGKESEEGIRYEITVGEIEVIFKNLYYNLSFPDKLNLLAQRIYQMYKGHGVIDELRDMQIDGLSAGVSGLTGTNYNYMEEILRERPSNLQDNNNSIWLFYHGKNIHLSFLSFGNQQELERVCKNIYRYNHPGQLSASNGYKVNDLYDGARVVVVRPPFSDSWAFFLRKFNENTVMNLSDMFQDRNSEMVIELMKWLIKGCQMIGITGEQGCGKTTLLKALIRFIDPSYTLRIQEQVFETHLRNIYPDRNIITFRETEYVKGQEALDLQKKTDGVVNILGEVASAPVAAWIVQLSQVGTKMTMFTNHANTTQKLVEYFRNALLSTNLFHNEEIAEKQVIDAIHFDIHMAKDRDGKRYIKRISEIIPIQRECEYDSMDFKECMKKYLYETGNHINYRIKDLILFDDTGYHCIASISQTKIHMIEENLTRSDVVRFREFKEQFVESLM